ncbi:protein SHQ1 homolog [Pieris rapae]|uniref:protein SHQ1 homolog n=1 Tax=Pieris rapae TaxID=64459 RepID=UPI001E27C068|nr:protein SHQ1 homolog [Pieris rapae]
MLTPSFKLSQDENHVFISVHAPYTNIGETDIDVDGENVLFVSSPYFLRLRLPGRILENEQSKGSYICDSGDFNLTFDKENPGEHFENLDMITSLLAPRDIPNLNPNLVEMLEEDGITIEHEEQDQGTSNQYGYGFACKITTKFHDIGNEFPQIFALKVPEEVSIQERHELRKKYENLKFSSDHYLADLYDDELINPYLTSKMQWDEKSFDDNAAFTEDQISLLKELPNKHYILTKSEHKQVFLSLVDILYGYCYDKRTTLNESTVESSWTINKMSSTLSWFCIYNDMKDVLVSCYRRALIFPIFRNFELCHKVKSDVVLLLKKNKKCVIKCLIDIHSMFNTSNDARYILNQLYINDYLIFLQKCRSEELIELSHNLANIDISKADLSLELDELEAAAEMVYQEETQVTENEMALKMASMSLLPKSKGNAVFYNDSSSSSSDSSNSSDLDSDDDSSSSGDPSDLLSIQDKFVIRTD